MKKKILLSLIAVVAVAGGVAALSAYEAHVINVTAHIENALSVETTPIEFGTVFPQEYIERDFTINLSSSFLAEDRVDDVEYVIKQKPKPNQVGIDFFNDDVVAAREYCHTATLPDPYCYLTLCPFLSKTDGDPEDGNDTPYVGYYVDPTPAEPNSGDEYCEDPGADAVGRLAKSEQDISDIWIVDLKVPPVAGFVGQDWPADCPVVEANDQDYGCDLWIEVTGISVSINEKEQTCLDSGGTLEINSCCLAVGDFLDTCGIGACTCALGDSHEVKFCNCGTGKCFNGSECVPQ